jgi:hypothetical protein
VTFFKKIFAATTVALTLATPALAKDWYILRHDDGTCPTLQQFGQAFGLGESFKNPIDVHNWLRATGSIDTYAVRKDANGEPYRVRFFYQENGAFIQMGLFTSLDECESESKSDVHLDDLRG